MAVRTLVLTQPGRMYAVTRAPGDPPLVVGRSAEADLRITELTLARRHFKLWLTDEGWWVEDLGSPSGIYLDGRTTHGPARLVPGSELWAGALRLRVREGE